MKQYQMEDDDEALAKAMELSRTEHRHSQGSSASSHDHKDQPLYSNSPALGESVTSSVKP